MPDYSKVTGRCPICRSYLVISSSSIVCPEGNYSANYKKWDSIWASFKPGRAQDDNVEKLMQDLLDLNEIEISEGEIKKLQKKALKKGII